MLKWQVLLTVFDKLTNQSEVRFGRRSSVVGRRGTWRKKIEKIHYEFSSVGLQVQYILLAHCYNCLLVS